MTTASARAVVTIDFHVGSWNAECTFDQMHQQITKEAKQILETRMKDAGLVIVGEPEIKFVVVKK